MKKIEVDLKVVSKRTDDPAGVQVIDFQIEKSTTNPSEGQREAATRALIPAGLAKSTANG